MGLVQVGRQKSYWENAAKSENLFGMPFFSDVVSRDKFAEIKKHCKGTREGMTEYFNWIGPSLYFPGKFVGTEVHFNCTLIHRPSSKLAFDEGMIGTLLNDEGRSYVPGKPDPNGFEFLGLADSYICYYLLWDRPHQNCKYTRPQEMATLMKQVAEHVEELCEAVWKCGPQPFIFYLDSRFSSLTTLDCYKEKGFFSVMSCGTNMGPKGLSSWLRGDDGDPKKHKAALLKLDKFDWRHVWDPTRQCYYMVLRAKKQTFLNMMSNLISDKSIHVMHRRRKFPESEYSINGPLVQQDYNSHKNFIDQWNRSRLRHVRKFKATNPGEVYVVILHF